MGSDYFQFLSTSNEQIPPFIYNFLILIGIDMLSLVFSSVFLKMSVNINLFQVSLPQFLKLSSEYLPFFQVYFFQQREFGLVLAGQQSHILDNLFCTIAIGCAIDLSLNFSWLNAGFVMDDTDPRFSTNVNISLLS